jgi:hypothetical protein
VVWGIDATQSIITHIYVMIFAFLYGLSMDSFAFLVLSTAPGLAGHHPQLLGAASVRPGALTDRRRARHSARLASLAPWRARSVAGAQ